MNKTYGAIPCDQCGRPTTMLSTRLCDRCWELGTRIGSTPPAVIAKIIRAEYSNDQVREIVEALR